MDIVPLVVIVVKTVSFDLVDVVVCAFPASTFCCWAVLGCWLLLAPDSLPLAVGVATKAEFSSLVMLM